MANKLNAAMYRDLYNQIEVRATQLVQGTTMAQRGRALGNSYLDGGNKVMHGSVFAGVNQVMQSMGDTAKMCRDTMRELVNPTGAADARITEVMGQLLVEEIQKPTNWTFVRRRSVGEIGWICKPRVGASVPGTMTGIANGTDYFLYFENRVNPVNMQELSFDFVLVEPNGMEKEITLPYIASKMGCKSEQEYRSTVRNRVLKWEKISLTADALMSPKYNYMAFYVYPRCVSRFKFLKKSTIVNGDTDYKNGAFILLPENYYNTNYFDARVMRLLSPAEYVSLFYKAEFEWCLKGVQPAFIPSERPMKRILTTMVQ